MADKQYIDQRGRVSLFDGAEEYESFVRKFEPKKTTDDCYTPPDIYDVIRDWVCREHGVGPAKIVRPFYPGGDYESEEYPAGCCVLDNPPFSILSQICAFYLARNIQFFLFAPSLTAFGSRTNVMRLCHIVCDANITYANGAVVRTAFATNLESGCIARTAPDLGRAITEAADKLRRETVRELPKYTYPMHILTAAMLQRYSKYGVDLRIRAEDCRPISNLDAQRAAGKAIFGGGLLLSDRAAAERAATERVAAERAAAERVAAERAAATEWQLSQRELQMVAELGGGHIGSNNPSTPKGSTSAAASQAADSIAPTPRCPNCQRIVYRCLWSYCPKCGTRLEWGKPGGPQ